MTTAISVPEQVEQEAHAIVTQARAIVIDSNPALADAAAFLRNVKTVLARIDETFDAPIKAAHEAHKAMLAAKKKHADPLLAAEREVKGKMGAYQQEQERLRRDEEARRRELARQLEEERMLAQAEALEASGDAQAAAAVLSAPIIAPPVVVPKAVPKIDGIKTRKVWKFSIMDADLIPRSFMIPNEQAIGNYARTMQGNARIPGIEFYSEDVISASGF